MSKAKQISAMPSLHAALTGDPLLDESTGIAGIAVRSGRATFVADSLLMRCLRTGIRIMGISGRRL